MGELSLFHPGADEVRQDAAEVLMAGIGEEAAGVRQHAHEAAEEPQVGEGPHLGFHAVLLVQEPPAGAELDLSGDAAALEVSDHGAQDIVVLGVQVVEDGLGEGVPVVQLVQDPRQGSRHALVVDGIEAGVGAQGLEAAGVVVP